MKRRIIVSLLAGAVLTGLCGLKGAYADKEEHQFELLKGEKHNAYTLFYPFRVEGPGMIKVHIKIQSSDKRKGMIQAVIIKGEGKRPSDIVAKGIFDGKHESMGLSHAVDDVELRNGKDYKVALHNVSRERIARGELLITYNGKNGPEKAAKPVHPDLSITGMSLNSANQLQVEVTNNGPGRLHSKAYEDNNLDLYLTRNGKRWGGASLKIVDPNKRLQVPGGKVTFTFDTFKVNGVEKVKAVIDSKRRCPEANEDNNVLIQEVGTAGAPEAQQAQPAKNEEAAKPLHINRGLKLGKKLEVAKIAQATEPDLAISRIWLVAGNRVAVEVVNKGAGLSPAYWDMDVPTLYLSRNGRGWGGATVKLFDLRKNLSKMGGKAVYVSKLTVNGKEEIKAVIDSQNTIAEPDENNNEMTVTLPAGQ